MKRTSFLFLFFVSLSIGYGAFYDHQVNGMGQPSEITVSPGALVHIDLMGFDVLDFDILYSLSNANGVFVGGPDFHPEILGESYFYSPQQLQVWGIPQIPQIYTGPIFFSLLIQCTDNVTLTTNIGYTLQINVQTSNPCVQVTTDACQYSKVGDDIVYDITIENCGDTDLSLISAIDSLLGDLTADVFATCGPTLATGESCTFQASYTVQPGDAPGPVINTTTVQCQSLLDGTLYEDADTAEVNLLHPNYSIDVRCLGIEGGFGSFEVEFVNIGDVPLDIQSDCSGSFQLVPDQAVVVPEQVPLVPSGGTCGGEGSATLTCSATATIPPEFCELPNVLVRSDSDTCIQESCVPDFTLEKTCLTSPWNDGDGPCYLVPGDIAHYEIIVTNTGTCDLIFLVDDPQAGIVGVLIGPLGPGQSGTLIGEEVVPPCDGQVGDIDMDQNVVTVEAFCPNGVPVGQATTSDKCCYNCYVPEGCITGYWRNNPACWCNLYAPATRLCDVWTELQNPPYDTIDDGEPKSNFDQDTLMDALNYQGGSGLSGATRLMLKESTAALLNSCSNDVAYPISVQMIIDLGNAALASENPAAMTDLQLLFADFNSGGCSLNTLCERIVPIIPIAIDDFHSQSTNLPVVILVLANDQDGQGSPLVNGTVFMNSFSSANGGTLTINPDQTVNYIPPADAVYVWDGVSDFATFTDTFIYYAVNADGARSTQPATVTITISRLLTLYVDDDGPHDPGGGDPDISDPNEDGTQAHPFDTIQEAIDAAINGGTVVVLPGTYTGTGNRDIRFFGKPITVQGTNPDNPAIVDQTVINCQGDPNEPHRGFVFDSGETNASILEGMTITGGYAETGAGIYISATSHPTIRKCLIFNNTAVKGGGIGGGQ